MTTDTIPAADTGLPLLTRRSALAGLALAGASITAGAALASSPTGDERLTALAAELKAIAVEMLRLKPALDEASQRFIDGLRDYTAKHGATAARDNLDSIYDRFHNRDLVDGTNALSDQACALADELRATPAVGLAGLAAKSIGLRWDVGTLYAFDDTMPEDDHDHPDAMLRQFARMLDQMTRGA